ncbi:uncharacterized protein PRCAT00003342001 [Priceomyces carsonii]|uniref:uncharacterized protein n=1 Tax=Priceomyces carsonii TaxID=28549 RepID=UPI002ED7E81B|nr:unnamed protein product [Priceomyces carsonii]
MAMLLRKLKNGFLAAIPNTFERHEQQLLLAEERERDYDVLDNGSRSGTAGSSNDAIQEEEEIEEEEEEELSNSNLKNKRIDQNATNGKLHKYRGPQDNSLEDTYGFDGKPNSNHIAMSVKEINPTGANKSTTNTRPLSLNHDNSLLIRRPSLSSNEASISKTDGPNRHDYQGNLHCDGILEITPPVPVNGADELLPLLPPSRRSSATVSSYKVIRASGFSFRNLCAYALDFRHPKLFHFIVLILVLFTIFAYTTLKKVDTLVSDFSEINLQSVSVLDLNDRGIDSHIIGTLYINYNNVHNIFYRNMLKFGSALVGVIVLLPSDAMKVYAKPAKSEVCYFHILDLIQPEVAVDVMNRRLTEIDFISQTLIRETEMVKLWELVNNLDEQTFELEVEAEIHPWIESKLFSFGKQDIRFKKVISLDKGSIFPPIKVKNMKTYSTDFSIQLSTQIVLERGLTLSATFPAINWDLLILDCSGNLIELGSWATEVFDVEPKSPIVINLHGDLRSIPNPLLKRCNNTDVSIFNKYVQDYMNGDVLSVYIRASKYQRVKMQNWLYYLLNHANYKVDALVTRRDLSITGYEIDALSLELPLNIPNDLLSLNVNTNASIIIDNQIDIQFSISKFKHYFCLLDSDETILLQGWSDQFNYVHINNVLRFLKFDLLLNHVKIEVLNSESLGNILNEICNFNFSDSLYAKVELEDVELILPIGALKLNRIDFEEMDITSQLDFHKPDEILKNLNVTIDELLFVDSNPMQALLIIKIRITNPTNFIVDLPGETITLGIKSNNTKVASFGFKDFFLSSEALSIQAELDLYNTPTELISKHTILDSLLSDYISGNIVHVDIFNLSVLNNCELNKMLNQIGVTNIEVPILKYSRQAYQNNELVTQGNDTEEHQSPFLLEAVIHLLTSEIQLTLYNPIENAELIVELYEAEAKYEDNLLGSISKREYLMIAPGIQKTPNIPIKISQGIGMDILRKAVNGQLYVDVEAHFLLKLDKFESMLTYNGHGLKSTIKF